MTFTAIDFETATGYRNSACAVGVVSVEDGEIVNKYYSLIRPPDNYYWRGNICIHGIHPADTAAAPDFSQLYPELRELLYGRIIVAHNESFDRGVLANTMAYYGLDYFNLGLPDRWQCTCRIYRAKGFRPCRLSDCCRYMGISLKHHEALSDAVACARLYMLR